MAKTLVLGAMLALNDQRKACIRLQRKAVRNLYSLVETALMEGHFNDTAKYVLRVEALKRYNFRGQDEKRGTGEAAADTCRVGDTQFGCTNGSGAGVEAGCGGGRDKIGARGCLHIRAKETGHRASTLPLPGPMLQSEHGVLLTMAAAEFVDNIHGSGDVARRPLLTSVITSLALAKARKDKIEKTGEQEWSQIFTDFWRGACWR
ncbi:hypothetical protein VTK73DRAFT_2988 [Phialemonium thermophilum]|uniref:Uncharacterized protein n=1 Tax=Phialemonium thermophilum TaxID=223376 RepID=A0ABR3Y136_9PEZI